MKEFVALREKTYSYSTDNHDEDKKTKTLKSVWQKENLNLKIMSIVQKQLNLRIK